MLEPTYLPSKVKRGGESGGRSCSQLGLLLLQLLRFGLNCFGIYIVLPAAQIVAALVLLRFCLCLSFRRLKKYLCLFRIIKAHKSTKQT